MIQKYLSNSRDYVIKTKSGIHKQDHIQKYSKKKV